jgi:hypothetical protein
MDIQADIQLDGQVGRWMERQKIYKWQEDKQTDGWTNRKADVWVYRQRERLMDGETDSWMVRP